MSLRTLCIAALALAVPVANADAACSRGSPACPVQVFFAPGTDNITLTGVLTPGRDCCVYALRARAGQMLSWRLSGPPAQTGILYPNQQGVGPGVPTSIRLPQSGVYLFGVRPSPMAENPFGPFALTIAIR